MQITNPKYSHLNYFAQHFYFQRAANWLQWDIIFIFDPNRPLYSTGTVLPPIMPNVSNLMDEKVITYMLMILFPYPHSSQIDYYDMEK